MSPGPFRHLHSGRTTSRAGDRDAVGRACVEPLEGRTLLSANPAGVQLFDAQGASATFVTEQTAAEWGLQPHSGDPAEPILVTAQVFGGASEFREVNGANHFFDTGGFVHITAVNPDTGEVYFDIVANSNQAVFSMSPSGRSATLDGVLPALDFSGVNVSVHMEWTATGAPGQTAASVAQEDENQVHVEVTRSFLREATASGTVTIDGYGAVNFTPGTSQSASLETFSFDTINRQLPSPTGQLFSQTPVLN